MEHTLIKSEEQLQQAVKELVIQEYMVEPYDEQDVENFIQDNIREYHEAQTMEDVAMEIADEIGGVKEAFINWDNYIDYEAIVRDLGFEGFWSEIEYQAEQEAEENGEEYTELYPDFDSKEAFVVELVRDGALSEEWIIERNYIQYDYIGRDLDIEGTFYYMGLGVYVEVIA